MFEFDFLRLHAMRIRELARVGEPPFSTRDLMEAAFPAALVTGAALPAWVRECVTITSEGPLVLYRRGMSSPEQRVAIAHAMAHLIFDVPEGRGAGLGRDPAIEFRADLFAAELLAPVDFLRCYVGPRRDGPGAEDVWLDMIDEISSQFQVPAEVIASQIERFSP